MVRVFLISFFVSIFLTAGCTKKTKPADMTPQQLAERGKAIYFSNCTACHSADPKVDGAMGPAIAGSSFELVEAKVVHGTYPPGYSPKKNTSQMAKLSHLKDEVPALVEFLKQ